MSIRTASVCLTVAALAAGCSSAPSRTGAAPSGAPAASPAAPSDGPGGASPGGARPSGSGGAASPPGAGGRRPTGSDGPSAVRGWLCTWEKLWLAERGDPDTAALALAKVAQARDMTSYRQLPAAERATVEADIAKARAGDASGFTAYAAVHC